MKSMERASSFREKNKEILVSASQICNLTDRTMWSYGSGGEVVEFDPISMKDSPDFEGDILYYIVENGSTLSKDPYLKKKVLHPEFRGIGRGGVGIVRLRKRDNTVIVPVGTELLLAN
ncbi:MAG: hypothetical protein Q4A36_02385 [Candidatus Saccharibacteria bacterium]|nr:hypothetical protein [Candidatus Saccharibacteria bacterium]